MIFEDFLWKFGAASTVGLVLFGAKYGHAGNLDADGMTLLNKSQVYHLMTNLALMGLAVRSQYKPLARPTAKYIAAGGLIGGILLFCVPLYVMAVEGRSEPMKALAPLGGISLLSGWLAMIFC